MSLWKLYYEDALQEGAVEGYTREDWDVLPVTGVQVLMKKLNPDEDGKSRVGWHTDDWYRKLFYDYHFYLWIEDDGPAGVTPDAILDYWYQYSGQDDVVIGDLSLSDLQLIGAKCGRSIPNEKFEAILQMAIDDPEIP